MDRIEPAGTPNARGHPPDSQAQSAESSSPPRPPLATLRSRGGSNRTRRPSIRLSRLPSISSLDTASTQQSEEQAGQSHGLSPGWQPTIGSPVAEEDEWQAGRRRSNSEPRRGRWSSPAPDVLSRVATPMRMMPVSEESNQPSPMPPPQVVDFQPTAEHAEPSPPRPVSQNVLRRTSQAALNRFHRNRASTVTGVVPTISQQRQQTNEYGPQVVDVLDVIGKALALASKSVLYGN